MELEGRDKVLAVSGMVDEAPSYPIEAKPLCSGDMSSYIDVPTMEETRRVRIDQ